MNLDNRSSEIVRSLDHTRTCFVREFQVVRRAMCESVGANWHPVNEREHGVGADRLSVGEHKRRLFAVSAR